MQLASRYAFPEPPLAAMWQLSENSRLGFRLAGSTLQQGFGAGKYLIGIGDTASVVRYAWLESLKAQQQNSSSTATTNPNAAAEQHQYDLVVNRVNKLLGSNDAADHIDSDGKLVGGNYEFSINHNDKSDTAFQRSLNKAMGEADGDTGAHGGLTPPTHRLGFSTSLHHDNDALHIDHFNGAKFPVGTLLHAIVDVGFGHLPYYGSNHAFSYAGVD
jgi:hypothetical protein